VKALVILPFQLKNSQKSQILFGFFGYVKKAKHAKKARVSKSGFKIPVWQP